MVKHSEQASTARQKLAQEAAQSNSQIKGVKVKAIKFAGYEDVYNMEVDDHHNFSVNGGFIVHNCMDALRYAVRQYMDLYDGSTGVDWNYQDHLAREMGFDV